MDSLKKYSKYIMYIKIMRQDVKYINWSMTME